jgi:hypothetical protein
MIHKEGAIDNVCCCCTQTREADKILKNSVSKDCFCCLMEVFFVPFQKSLVDTLNFKENLASLRRFVGGRGSGRRGSERDI